MKYKVSVIVPVYRVEDYIARCAVSLFEQTMEEVEYIFVDDCTPDRSMQILEEVASRYPGRQKHIQYVRLASNGGVSAARNIALAIAKGEYLFFADGDDWTETNVLSTLYKAAEEENADIVRSDFFCTYLNHEEYVNQGKNKNDPAKCVKALLIEKMHGALWTKLVRLSLFRDHEVHFYDGNWNDLRASVQLFYYATKIVYVPKAFYHYVQYNSNSLSVTNMDKRLTEMIRQTDGMIEFLKDKPVQFDKQISYLKLAAKQTLLFSCDKRTYHKWRQIYPESNRHIWSYSALPVHLRLIGGCVSLKLWPLVNLWIWAKKRHNG
jgi:glycosyltransferase involved in cell wall biosynthesis